MDLGGMLQQIVDAFTSTEAPPAWVSLLAPSLIAVTGVLIAQIVLLRNERSRQHLEQSKFARDAAEQLATLLYNYLLHIHTTYRKDEFRQIQALQERWGTVNAKAGQLHELIPSRSHRRALRQLLRALDYADQMAREGYEVATSIHGHYDVLTGSAHNTVAAWLRHEPVPRKSRRVARKAGRQLAALWLFRQEVYEPDRKIGVVVNWARSIRFRVIRRTNKMLAPAKKLWKFLFAI